MYDIGTFIGGILLGYFGDKYGYKAMTMFFSLFLATVLMIIIKYC